MEHEEYRSQLCGAMANEPGVGTPLGKKCSQ